MNGPHASAPAAAAPLRKALRPNVVVMTRLVSAAAPLAAAKRGEQQLEGCQGRLPVGPHPGSRFAGLRSDRRRKASRRTRKSRAAPEAGRIRTLAIVTIWVKGS